MLLFEFEKLCGSFLTFCSCLIIIFAIFITKKKQKTKTEKPKKTSKKDKKNEKIMIVIHLIDEYLAF